MMDCDLADREILLRSTNARKLGEIHVAILSADNRLIEQTQVIEKETKKGFPSGLVKLTPLGEEIGGHFIKWWVNKNVEKLGSILEKIDKAYDSMVKLKRDSEDLSTKSMATSYESLLEELMDFADNHTKEIDEFSVFVSYLKEINNFAPCILFSCPPWSTSDCSERFLNIGEKTDERQLEISSRIVFGLWSWPFGSTLDKIRNELESEYADSVDPEDYKPTSIPASTAFPRASKKILYEFGTYFREIRESMDLIRSEITSLLKEEILKNEAFLASFVAKAVPKFRPECELWDFKETISVWHKTDDDKLKADFACNVASFANHKGGLILIGIEDENRKIVGVKEVETRIRQSRSVLEAFLDIFPDSLELISVPLKNENGNTVSCLVIKIPQTKDVIGVRETKGGSSYKYPVRSDDGIKYKSHCEVSKMKEGVQKDNFSFAKCIADFVYFTNDSLD